MNRTYRLVWSRRTNSWVVVSEITRARRGGRALSPIVLALTALAAPTAFPQLVKPNTVTPAQNAQTQAYVAPNGVPVVNIQNPNGAGLSHNRYTQFGVESKGLVLNNATPGQESVGTSLAGRIFTNPNLVNPASIILNEVTANNPSIIKGFTEVAGSKADVVVANPFGITCQGCGFINTDRVTLTTGSPTIGVGGVLTGFSVSGGAIAIGGTGANLSDQQKVDLVTRSLVVDGPINAKDLSIATGVNAWDYKTGSVTGTVTSTGAAPSYAVDSTALGGMYANKITIVATEAGVGVRMLGAAAVSAGDFRITSAGKVEVKSAISASETVSINTTSKSGVDDFALSGPDAKISADGSVLLTITDGNIKLAGGTIYAGKDLNIKGASLNDAGTVSNARYGKEQNTLNVSGASRISGTDWSAGRALVQTYADGQLQGQTTIRSGDTITLTAYTGDLSLGASTVKSPGAISLSSDAGAIRIDAGATQGIESSQANVLLTAATNVENAGTVSATQGALTVRANNSLSNSGKLQAGGAVTVGDKNNTKATNLTNSGTIVASGAMSLEGATLVNTGVIQGSGASTVAIANALTNQEGGKVLSGAALTISADSLANAGVIQGANTGTMTTTNAITNSGVITLSNGALYDGSITSSTLNNSGAIQADGSLALNVSGVLIDNSGKLLAGKNLSLASTGPTLNLTNRSGGTIQAGANSGTTLTISGSAVSLDNQGKIIGDRLSISGAAIGNSGTIQGGAAANSSISATGAVNNSGTIILATDAIGGGTLTADTVVNTGVIQSEGKAALVAGTTLSNQGTIAAANGATLTGSDAAFSISNAGRIQSAAGKVLIEGQNGSAGVDLSVGSAGVIVAETVEVKAGTLALANSALLSSSGNMSLNATTLTMGGSGSKIVGATGSGQLTINTTNPLSNSGAIHSGNDLSLTAPGVTVTDTGAISALRNSTITASGGDVNNRGALYAGGSMSVSAASGEIRNWANGTSAYSGTIDGGHISLSAPTVTNNSKIIGTESVTITSADLRNAIPDGDTRTWTKTASGTETYISSTGYDYHGPVPNDRLISDGRRQWETYSVTDTYQQSYSTGAAPTVKPQILSGGSLTINGFDSATNLGGVISGGTVTLSGKGGATFTNDDLSLQQKISTEVYDKFSMQSGLGPAMYYQNVKVNTATNINDRKTSDTAYQANPSHSYSTIASFGAGVFANTLNAGGFTLVNAGSPYASSVAVRSVAGGSATAGQSVAARENSVGRSDLVTLGSLSLSLPTNPNGYFVATPNPRSNYVIETNPSFGVISQAYSSDYLFTLMGVRPEDIQRRLGDANYEANLIRQQLIDQAKRPVLANYTSEAQQLQALWDNAFSQGTTLGLTIGVAPTPIQLASLSEDIVWMVETTVNGEKVLAPVVYLAQKTKLAYAAGAIIAATDATLNLDGLKNTGGSIAGSGSLNIASKGDITNISGTISGGNVSLKSSAGSIKNETLATTTGGAANQQTTIGKTGAIQATGNLTLDAGKDVTVLGGVVRSDKNADIKAGGEVRFDTVQDKRSMTVATTSGNTSRVDSMSSINQVKSGLTVGGNLTASSGKDLTFAGTDVQVGGGAKLNSGGDTNIIARENVRKTTSVVEQEGFGVGGGVYGTSTTTTESESTRNVASSFNVKGNTELDAKNRLLVKGSEVTVGGDTSIIAKDVSVLAGKDTDTTTTTTVTTTFLQVENLGDGEEKSASAKTSVGTTLNSSAEAQQSSGKGSYSASANAAAEAGAEAGASAEASYANSGGFTLAKTTTQTDKTTSQRSVGSSLNLGGDVKISASKDLTLQGSELNAGGNLAISAKNVNLLAAQNIETKESSTQTVRVGVYAETRNEASAEALASAGAKGSASAQANASKSGAADAGATVSAEVNAEVKAEAAAKTTNNVDFLRVDTSSESTKTVTNTGSVLRSGGNTKINASGNVRSVGSTIESAGDVDLSAKNLVFEAANDAVTTTKTTSTTRAGLYADAGVDASAGAKASASLEASAGASAAGGAKASGSLSAEASANAEANSRAGAGIQVRDERNSIETGSSTAVVSSIKSGGNISRTATGVIKDVGTTIEATGNLVQSAEIISSLAAENSQYTKSSSSVSKVRIGNYAEADAEAKAGASASAGGGVGSGSTSNPSASAKAEANAGAGARVGAELSIDLDLASESKRSTQAVVSNVKVGGNLKSTATKSTTLVGTNLDAGGGVELNSTEVNILAAKDTTELSKTLSKTNFTIGADIGVGASAEAKAGASSSGGGSGNAEAAAGVQVGGKVGLKFEGSQESEDTSKAVTARISGANVKIGSTGTTTLEGITIEAGSGGVSLTAGSLDFKAAQNTSSSTKSTQSIDGQAKVRATVLFGSDVDASAKGDVGVGVASSSATEAVVGSISSKGGLAVTTQGDTRLEGVQTNVSGDTSIIAGGNLKIDAARNTSKSTSVDAKVGFSFDKDEGEGSLNVGVGVNTASATKSVVSNLNTQGSLTLASGKDVSIEGANIGAGKDVQLAAGGTVSFKEARDAASSTKVDVGVKVGATNKDEENQIKGTKSETQGGSLGLDASVNVSNSSTAVTGSLKAGNNLSVTAGKDVSFVGTDLAAGKSAQISAAGDVNFKAAQSTSLNVDVGLGLSGSVSKEATQKADGKGATSTEQTNTGSGSIEFGVGYASDQKVTSLNVGAGGVSVSSGANVNLQGAQLNSAGNTVIAAAGTVNKTSATSVSVTAGAAASLEGASKSTTKSADSSASEGASKSAASGTKSESEGAGGATQLNASVNVDTTSTKISGSSVTVKSNVPPATTIPGTSVTVRATARSDGSVSATVPIPAGYIAVAKQSDGSALPSWVKFDSKTGTVSGTPPAGHTGGVSIVVEVPQPDGSMRRVGVNF